MHWLYYCESCSELILPDTKCETYIFMLLNECVIIYWLIVADDPHFLTDSDIINDIDTNSLLGIVSATTHGIATEKVWDIRSCGIHTK